ncbi:MAG: NAD(+)/NADH kinase [Deltaproteobacteria bacterium]|nr:NAD(+)/NADH kinase [Deltaproteobacteria bacterium]
MKRIGLIVKNGSPEAVETAASVAAWITGRGGEVYACQGLGLECKDIVKVVSGELSDNIDVLLVLGGDGTMLSAARLLDGARIPILGVNLGGLGFLTAIRTAEMTPLLERVMKDEFVTEERMALDVTVRRPGGEILRHRVLNDAVIKGVSARLIRLETRINKEYITTYRADGLIVATPTGSTAYSLSAAGPILYPTIHSIIVAPICPFNLTNRPVVIPDWMTVEVVVPQGQSGVQLILDGQVDTVLMPGDTVEVNRSVAGVWLVKYEGKGYFEILRERLMWEPKQER